MKNPVRTPQMHYEQKGSVLIKGRRLKEEVRAAKDAGAVSYQQLRAFEQAKRRWKELDRSKKWALGKGGAFASRGAAKLARAQVPHIRLKPQPERLEGIKSEEADGWGFRIARTKK